MPQFTFADINFASRLKFAMNASALHHVLADCAAEFGIFIPTFLFLDR